MAAAQLAPVRRRLGTASYPAWFYIPAAVVFGVLFLAPMIMSFYFSLTRWTLFESTFIGFENFVQFYREPFLVKGLTNTLIYATLAGIIGVCLGTAISYIVARTKVIGARWLDWRGAVKLPISS